MLIKLEVGGCCSNIHSPRDRIGKCQAKIGYQWSVSSNNVVGAETKWGDGQKPAGN